MRSAPAFQQQMVPSGVLEKMASSLDATMAANSSWCPAFLADSKNVEPRSDLSRLRNVIDLLVSFTSVAEPFAFLGTEQRLNS
jgi:hypothetical protein